MNPEPGWTLATWEGSRWEQHRDFAALSRAALRHRPAAILLESPEGFRRHDDLNPESVTRSCAVLK